MEDRSFGDQSLSFWRIQATRVSGSPKIDLLHRIPPTHFVPAAWPGAFIFLYPSSGPPPHAAMIVPTLYFLSAALSPPSASTLSPSNGLNVFVRASLPGPPLDATALPLCPVCGIASGKSCFDCEQQFCVNHIYACADCGNQYCGACLDAHHADGHWADSDTAFELAASHRTGRSSSASELAAARVQFARRLVIGPILTPPHAV